MISVILFLTVVTLGYISFFWYRRLYYD